MLCVQLTGHGGNEVVQIDDQPPPVRKEGEILVALKARTTNRVDLYMRNSGVGITHALPLTLGVDGAGVILETDDSETVFRVGDRVVLYPAIFCGDCEPCLRGQEMACVKVRFLGEQIDGTYCETIAVPRANVFPAPAAFSHIEAAALGVAYLTAWRMVFTLGEVKPWSRVLIFGTGAVSLAALQLVKLVNAEAIVVGRRSAHLSFATNLGADLVVNSEREDVVRAVMELSRGKGVDLVVESVGEPYWPMALRALSQSGRLVTCGATAGANPSAELSRLFVRHIKVMGTSLGSRKEFHQLLNVAAREKFKPIIAKDYKLADAPTALSAAESGAEIGKIALVS